MRQALCRHGCALTGIDCIALRTHGFNTTRRGDGRDHRIHTREGVGFGACSSVWTRPVSSSRRCCRCRRWTRGGTGEAIEPSALFLRRLCHRTATPLSSSSLPSNRHTSFSVVSATEPARPDGAGAHCGVRKGRVAADRRSGQHASMDRIFAVVRAAATSPGRPRSCAMGSDPTARTEGPLAGPPSRQRARSPRNAATAIHRTAASPASLLCMQASSPASITTGLPRRAFSSSGGLASRPDLGRRALLWRGPWAAARQACTSNSAPAPARIARCSRSFRVGGMTNCSIDGRRLPPEAPMAVDASSAGLTAATSMAVWHHQLAVRPVPGESAGMGASGRRVGGFVACA